MSVCVCVCVCVTICCGTTCYSFSFSNQTDHKETRRRVWRGRNWGGEIGKGRIREGGCDETLLCLSLNWESCRFTAPPAVALLNYTSCAILWRIFCQTGIFAGFSLYTCIFHRKEQRSCDGRGTLYLLRCRVAHLGWGIRREEEEETNM